VVLQPWATAVTDILENLSGALHPAFVSGPRESICNTK